MIWNETNPEKNAGKGFVQFKDAAVAKKVIETSQEIKTSPDKKVLLDPENHYEISGRPLFILSAISRDDLAKKMRPVTDPKMIKKMRAGKMTFDELISTDIYDKKNFKLAKEGLYISEDNLHTDDKFETEKRIHHLDEKLTKMANPNYKMSDTRIAFKNIDKKIDEAFLKQFVREVLADTLSAKVFNKTKIIKQLKVLYEEGPDSKSKGIAFVEFVNPAHALTFMKKMALPEFYKTISNPRKQMPIVEFAFVDARIVRKQEEAVKKLKKAQKNENNDLVKDYIGQAKTDQSSKKATKAKVPDQKDSTKTEQPKKENLAEVNRKNLARVLTDESIRNNDDQKAQEAAQAIGKLISRGLKQRLFNKLNKAFPQLKSKSKKQKTSEVANKVKQTKELKNKVVPNPSRVKKIQKPDPALKMLEDIKKSVKGKLKSKNSAFNKILEHGDDYEQKFLSSTFKSAK